MAYPKKAETCSRSSLLCASGVKVISSPAARNVFRFWTNAPENPFECKYTTRKGKSLRRTIWNWLVLRIEMDVYGVPPPPNARTKTFAMYNAIHNSVIYDALTVPSNLSHVVESTCSPLTLTAAV